MHRFRFLHPTPDAAEVDFDTEEVTSLVPIDGGVRVELTNDWILDLEATSNEIQVLVEAVAEKSGALGAVLGDPSKRNETT